MFDQKINLKTVIILILISILMASGTTYILAQTPTSTFTISPGIYPGAPSYTIWKEGNYYYAKDSIGAIKYSGSDASTVIQSALNNLGVDGGAIFLKNGEYLWTTTVSVPYNMTSIIGEGRNTVIKISANNIAVFSITGTGTNTMKNRIRITHLTIDGNSRTFTSDALRFRYAASIYLENLRIIDVKGTAIYAEVVWELWVMGSILSRCGDSTNTKPVVELKSISSSENTNNLKFVNSFIDCPYYKGAVIGSQCRKIAFVAGSKFHGIAGQDYEMFDINGAYQIQFSDVGFDAVQKVGILASNSYGIQINNIRFTSGVSWDYAIRLINTKENTIENVIIGSQQLSGTAPTLAGISIEEASQGTTISNIWAYGSRNTLDIQSNEVSVTNFNLYYADRNGIRVINAENVTISNGIIFEASQETANTYDGLLLASAKRVIVSNLLISGSQHYFGVEESGTSDYNIIIGVDAYNNINGIKKIGINTYVNLCWNGTSWIP